ncbi:hypothetical protein ACH46F_32650 [Streptomyces virginiae]|uniref:hypothetical protein n=1 Tax=Streptomyces virginiae TaxID=1961 RepID=UPI0037A33334
MSNDVYNETRYAESAPETKHFQQRNQNRWGNSAQATYFNGAMGQLSSVTRYAMPANDDFMSYWDFFADCFDVYEESARERQREMSIRESIRALPDDEPYTETMNMREVNGALQDFSETWTLFEEVGVPEKQGDCPRPLVNLQESDGLEWVTLQESGTLLGPVS